MLSAKLRAALDNLLPDAGEDEAYLGTPTLRDAAVLIAFTARPDPGVILTQRPQWLRSHAGRSEEHTSELQSLMRISYAVFCLQKKKKGCTIAENRNMTLHKGLEAN